MTRLGQSVPHDSAREHVRGSAAYIDDLPPLRGELLVDFVGSPVAFGRIRSIDVEAARKTSGIAAVFTWADVPGDLLFGPILHDEELLVKEFVQFHGQPIVLIAGEDRAAIESAKKRVLIDVEKLPPVLTILSQTVLGSIFGPLGLILASPLTAAVMVGVKMIYVETILGDRAE